MIIIEFTVLTTIYHRHSLQSLLNLKGGGRRGDSYFYQSATGSLLIAVSYSQSHASLNKFRFTVRNFLCGIQLFFFAAYVTIGVDGSAVWLPIKDS